MFCHLLKFIFCVLFCCTYIYPLVLSAFKIAFWMHNDYLYSGCLCRNPTFHNSCSVRWSQCSGDYLCAQSLQPRLDWCSSVSSRNLWLLLPPAGYFSVLISGGPSLKAQWDYFHAQMTDSHCYSGWTVMNPLPKPVPEAYPHFWPPHCWWSLFGVLGP